MRLATKLTLALLIAVALVMTGFAYWRARGERQHAVDEAKDEALLLANTLRLAVQHALRDRQPEYIRELLDELVRSPNPVDRIRVLDRQLDPINIASAESAEAIVIPPADLERTLTSGQTVVRYMESAGRPMVYVLLPLRSPRGTILGVLEVAHVATQVRRQIQEATRELILRSTLLGCTIFLVIWLAVRISIRRPIGQLTGVALALGQGDFARRLDLRRRDEIGQLAAAFNRMAENLQAARGQILAGAQARLALERQLQQAQKLATVGRLASEVAHEIGTPLNVVSGRAEAIQRRLDPDHPLARHVATILRQVERISDIIRQLLEYTRPRRPAVHGLDARQSLSRAVELLEPLARHRQVDLRVESPGPLPPIQADPDLLQQVLLNLVTNALDATPSGGSIRLSADLGDPGERAAAGGAARPRVSRGRPDGPVLTIAVADTGAGMSRPQLERIFEPFFSTKDRKGGTGLGLPIVEDIVRAHGGAIEIESAEGLGTTVWLRWPLAAADGRSPEPTLAQAAASGEIEPRPPDPEGAGPTP
jgi:signal transduction histidine kinase